MRGSLSRGEILEAGLQIGRQGDLRNLTMKRLGDDLGVTGMAIYRHFRNKSEVIDGILDHFVHEADVTSHGTDPADWRRWLVMTSTGQYRALAETPGVLPFVATSEAWRFGPAAKAVLDETLRVLERAGFEAREAREIYTTSLALAVGWATLESRPGPRHSASEATAEPFERCLDRYLAAAWPSPARESAKKKK